MVEIACMLVNSFHSFAALYASTLCAGTYTGMDLSTLLKHANPQSGGIIASQVIEVSPSQPLKAQYPMLVTDSGIVIEVRLVQPEKTIPPIFVAELGIVIEVRLEQPIKVLPSIQVIEFGIVMEVRLEHM